MLPALEVTNNKGQDFFDKATEAWERLYGSKDQPHKDNYFKHLETLKKAVYEKRYSNIPTTVKKPIKKRM